MLSSTQGNTDVVRYLSRTAPSPQRGPKKAQGNWFLLLSLLFQIMCPRFSFVPRISLPQGWAFTEKGGEQKFIFVFRDHQLFDSIQGWPQFKAPGNWNWKEQKKKNNQPWIGVMVHCRYHNTHNLCRESVWRKPASLPPLTPSGPNKGENFLRRAVQ